MSEYTKKKLQLEKYQDCLKSQTLQEVNDKYIHIRRVAAGSSKLQLGENSNDEYFGNVYSEFLQTYSKGQLQHLEKTFLAADLDHDCKLNQVELMSWMTNEGCPMNQEELVEIFNQADDDGDGVLSFREFVSMCDKLGLKNIPSESKFIASHTIQPDFEECTCSRNSNNNYNEEECVSPFDYQNNKPTFSVKPELDEIENVNIQQAVKYFECEISKENRKKEHDVHLGEYLTEGKQRMKTNKTIAPLNRNCTKPTDDNESDAKQCSRHLKSRDEPTRISRHDNQPNYVNKRNNLALSERLLKATRQINPRDQSDSSHFIQNSQGPRMSSFPSRNAEIGRSERRSVNQHNLDQSQVFDISEFNNSNVHVAQHNSNRNSLQSNKGASFSSEQGRVEQYQDAVDTNERKLSNSSKIADQDARKFSNEQPEKRSSLRYESSPGGRGSLTYPPNYVPPENSEQFNRRASDPYAEKKRGSGSVYEQSDRKRTSLPPNYPAPLEVEYPNMKNQRPSFPKSGEAVVQRSSLPNPSTLPQTDNMESPRRNTYPDATAHRNRNSSAKEGYNVENGGRNSYESHRYEVPKTSLETPPLDESPIIPDYLFQEHQKTTLNDQRYGIHRSSGNNRGNSLPASNDRKESFGQTQPKRHSDPQPQQEHRLSGNSSAREPRNNSHAFNEARQMFNNPVPPPLPDKEWNSGIAKTGTHSFIEANPAKESVDKPRKDFRRRSTLEEIDKEARRSSILGAVATRRNSKDDENKLNTPAI